LGTGEKEKDRILVLPLSKSFKKEGLSDVLECMPLL